LDADHHLFHVLVAAAALASGDPERSETAARRAIETNPSRGTGYSRLADALEYRGEWDEVRTVLRELRAIDSDAGEVLAAMGRLDERAGDLESAKRQYRAALDAAQPGYQARWRLAAILLEAGKRQEAESLLTEVTAEQRAQGPVARRLADAELALGNLEAALAHLEPALAERAALPVRLLEAEILDQLGRTAQARESRLQTVALADRMLNVAGRFPTVIYLWRARALEGLGERAEAREALRPVLEQSDALSFEDRQTMRALAARLGVQVRGLR
jgi:tetratricopeptide (TPR) repeat protein